MDRLPQVSPGQTNHLEVDESFCGCCGRECPTEAQWCTECASHVAGPLSPVTGAPRPPWDQTYQTQHGRPCPYRRDADPLEAFCLRVGGLAALAAILRQPEQAIRLMRQAPSSQSPQ